MGKRNNSGYNNRNNAGREAARNIGVVLALGGLSFFLGFYVLARMVPDKHDASGLQSASASPAPPQSARMTASSVANTTPAVTPADPPSVTKKIVRETPSLEPGDEPAMQVPGKIDGATQPPANNLDTVDKPTTPPAEPAPDTEGTGTAATPPRKGRRVRSGDSESASATDKTETGGIHAGDQKPSRIDREETSTEAPSESTSRVDSGDSETPKPEVRAKRTRYRVQGTTHSRLEAANREARRITDLGMEAVVVPITTEDGTTVYRVQQGVYRSRANAEAAKQKLKDADIEASVVKTSGQ